ncbi:Poly [ADP-ribose] polymerase 2 [Fusarium oxysporum f. sp. albedinis]|nr:Poly [ADP-ribose] polymerase 2 [Fusarium oxysporum f. sp. albedinis]
MATCFLNNVYCCYLPAHCSHGLQPLDNGVFNVSKAAYRKELQKLASLTDSAPIDKVNFIKAYAKARETSRHIRDLGKNKSPSTRRRYSVISKGFKSQESKITSLSTRIAGLEEEVGWLSRGKKRKVILNPNKKFIMLAEALAASNTILELNEVGMTGRWVLHGIVD